MTTYENMISTLYRVLMTVKSEEDMSDLFDDLCTYKEIENMAGRLRAAYLLMEGKTYSDIIFETGISSATLSRISKCIQRGSGGYTKVLKEAENEIELYK